MAQLLAIRLFSLGKSETQLALVRVWTAQYSLRLAGAHRNNIKMLNSSHC
jgi:hypothetical protein